ncbi:MAG: ScyD/ScyE family protein [Caldilineaceae bacterium]|nr:ScyD/ScyE family protein [Caldilineaceae bacterium]
MRYTFSIWLLFSLLCTACTGSPQIEIVATGLNQPRGMTFDTAGNLYVAEAGAVDPEDSSTITPKINHSSRVVRIGPDREIIPVIEDLPFTNYIVAGDIGATDVAMLDSTLYILTGEGYDDDLSRAILRLTADGDLQPIVNIRRFIEFITPMDSLMGLGASHAANPFAMIPAPDGENFYISDGASGRVLKMSRDGVLNVWAEWPNMPPLTGLAFGPDDHLYVAMLSALPFGPGNGAILRAESDGELTIVAPELTMVIDVAFDAAGVMYVLEISSGPTPTQLYAPNSGRLLRIEEDSTPTILIKALNYPTAMIFSAQGDLYLSVNGAFSAPGEGAIWKVNRKFIQNR